MTENASRMYPAMPNALAERIQKAIPDIHKQRNETIFKAGDSARSLYVVRKGIVFSRQSDEKAQRSFIDHVFHPGQIVGVEAVVSENAYRSTAVSANNSEMVSIHQAEMEALVAEYPLFFLQLVTYHIRELEQLRQRFKLPISERVLVSIEEFRNGNNLVSVDQSVIAERSGGADRSSVNATLSEQGIVWEKIADPSLKQDRAVTKQKVLKAILVHIRARKQKRLTREELAEKVNLSVSTLGQYLAELKITMNDLELLEGEFTTNRVFRAIDSHRDENGRLLSDITQADIAEELQISIRTLNRSLASRGYRWSNLNNSTYLEGSNALPIEIQERVVVILDKFKDSSGVISATQEQVAEAAGVSVRTLRNILSGLEIHWKEIAKTPKKDKEPRVQEPKSVSKVLQALEQYSDQDGLIPLSQKVFAAKAGVSIKTLHTVLKTKEIKWSDIARP